MLTVERCRRLLGEEYSHLSDEEVADLLQALRTFAVLGIETAIQTHKRDE